jgi:xylulokinase
VGGGARSRAWIAILASALGIPLNRIAEGDTGAAAGAARLARLAVTGEAVEAVCGRRPVTETIPPDAALRDAYGERLIRYREAISAARLDLS